MTRLSITLAALALAACGGRVGSGNIVTETRNVSGFTAVQNDTSLRLNVQEGPGTSVSVTIDDNLQELVTFEVVGETLILGVDHRDGGIRSTGGGVHVDVRLPNLRGAEGNGSGRIVLTEIGGGEDVALENNGSGGLEFSGSANEITVLSTGSGSLKLQGSAERLVVKVTGSGSVDSTDLEARSADLETTGSGSIFARLSGGTVSLAVHGSGSIEWRGDATVLSMEDDGSGSISHR